ncbi:hypothetical protein [Lactococcus fujiensis]|uniref:Uncharacterized protein n=1 Tax=Lactococcus fujiensis JCM 16395 TaxID=1291764 RepID=A0A2A5RMZ2_9LACT|nr:hypothetical protein [Lactococcus fujiensis]PCS00722.1 hypothetical protein RT41_GL001104 [Lactococcus fujiensis JCM 16395]
MANFITDMKALISELAENVEAVKTNVERVKIEMVSAEKTAQSIQRKVTEFQTSAQPRIDKINKLIENIKEKTSSTEKTD